MEALWVVLEVAFFQEFASEMHSFAPANQLDLALREQPECWAGEQAVLVAEHVVILQAGCSGSLEGAASFQA